MSQNSLVLATTGTLSGLAAVQGINNALDTLNTLASGSSAPSSPEAGQFWHDTANKLIKIRSMDNTTWIVIGTLNETGYTFVASSAAALSATLAIASGGTGATTAATALTALLSGSIVPVANGGTGVSLVKNLWSFYPGVNGYEVSPSGRITQWGVTGNFIAGASGNVSYPIAFPSAALNVTATLAGGSGISDAAPTVLNVSSTSAFTLVNQSSVTVQIYWHAEGY